MSGIAHLLLRRGLEVSGSDLKDGATTRELKKMGARIFLGHEAANITGADLIIYSSAIKEDNPEVREAKRLNKPLIKRAEALAQLMQDKSVITVAGSHGKTTTTSLISYLLLNAGLMPTAAIGGILRNIDSNALSGDGKYFVAEADESDGSFLCYRPKYSVITNIDREHLDYYKDFANEVKAFKEFTERTEEDGVLFLCADDPNLRDILKSYKNRHVLFGLGEGADIVPRNINLKELSSDFDCFFKDKFVANFQLALGGRHNISNSLSVIALGLELGIDLKVIQKTLAEYQGAKRRLEIKFSANGILVIDDYAHHPTEIRATLEALKNLKRKRVLAVFQPHRFSRTQLLLDEFGKSFENVDFVAITDIYPAGEPAIKGIDAKRVLEKIKEYSPLKESRYIAKEEIVTYLLGALTPGDLVILLGAGDIVKISDELAEKLKG